MELRSEEVRIIRQGIQGKDYKFYCLEAKALANKIPLEEGVELSQHRLKKELFLLESLSQFLRKIQDVEPLYRENLYQVRLEIGRLFIAPTVEVRIKETGRLVAVFESMKGYKKVSYGVEEFEKLQENNFANQIELMKTEEKLEKAKDLRKNPSLIFQSAYSDFLNQEISESGFFQGLFAYILRRKHHEYYASEIGQQALTDIIKELQQNVLTIRGELEQYGTQLIELEIKKEEHRQYQAGFDYLATGYGIPSFISTD